MSKISARKGGLRRHELYGNFGTPEGRRKGGLASQALFRTNPEYAKKLGVRVRKTIREPASSPELAEVIGIVLGDGGISYYQVTVTLDKDDDKEYHPYVQELLEKTFSVSSLVMIRTSCDAITIVVSSRNVVEFLEKQGLRKGSKIINKADIPRWILNDKNCRIACLRGLMDTDGSFYSYRHKVYGKIYRNCAICFTNYSGPLLESVYKILKNLGFTPVLSDKRVYLHKTNEIRRYFKEIGTNNPKHLNKYRDYLQSCDLAA